MKEKKTTHTTWTTAFIAVLLLTCIVVGCGKQAKDKAVSASTAEREAGETANGIMNAFAAQDADALDTYLPGSGIGSFVYNDPEGFVMYTEKMSWEITGCKEETDGMSVVMRVKNVDMVKILEEHPPKAGEQMPNPTPEQIAQTETKTFDYVMPLVKTENGYRFSTDESDPEGSMKRMGELLNVITGGGYQYLDDLQQDFAEDLQDDI